MEIFGTGHISDPAGDYWDAATILTQRNIASVDLRPHTSKRHNQGQTGSCVAQAVCKALEIRQRLVQHSQGVDPKLITHTDISRLHLYFLAREMMNPSRVGKDEGTHISLACHVLNRFGVCSERSWPFSPSKVNHAPSWAAMREAAGSKVAVKDYWRIQSGGNDRVESCLHALSQGFPVVFGTKVGDQWHGYRGDVPLVVPKQLGGGHATVLVGWDNRTGVFIGENSWGSGWGKDGFYTMSPDVIASIWSSDFWIIRGTGE